MEPAKDEVEPVGGVRALGVRHRSSAIATSSSRRCRAPRRARCRSAPQHLEDLRLRPAVDEDDEAEAEALLVSAFSRASSASTAGSASAPCSAAERAERPARCRSPGARQRLELLVLGQRRRSPRARCRAGRRLRRAGGRARCRLRTARRAAPRLAAAVDRARVGREEERDVVVAAVLDLDLGLDAPEERRLRVEDEPIGPGSTSARSGMRPSSSVSRSATSASPRKSCDPHAAGGHAASRCRGRGWRSPPHLRAIAGRAGAGRPAPRTRTRRSRRRGCFATIAVHGSP